MGRRDALTQFTASWQDVLAGHPRVFLIAGEAGVGKTKLLTECQTLARHLQANVYAGRCYEGQFLPYAPFAEALNQLSEAEAEIPEEPLDHIKQDREILNRLLLQRVPANADLVQAEQVESDRLRLFLAISRTMVALARRHHGAICGR
ncbi:AAA family ATPase [Candidatus Entotheonella palauensis]|uniref:AAA family ATPase n=1 Tax=Candidatus Entotheonella palauensis TaxID=93172 RepID=UPI0015C49993|nr:ATP-binding protein [Candidatus Entotheonella palauensis]